MHKIEKLRIIATELTVASVYLVERGVRSEGQEEVVSKNDFRDRHADKEMVGYGALALAVQLQVDQMQTAGKKI